MIRSMRITTCRSISCYGCSAYQQHLFAHPGYRAVLGAFGPNLLFKTGIRAVKRQSDHAAPADRGDPARMRAIPNNAILQQFGYIANVVAGLGAAVGSERDRFVALARKSSAPAASGRDDRARQAALEPQRHGRPTPSSSMPASGRRAHRGDASRH